MDDAQITIPDENTLFRRYLQKLVPDLRQVLLSKEWVLDKGPPTTWKECAECVGHELESRADSKSPPIEIAYTVVLRTEFVPVGADVGPTRDLYFKVFPKGTCQVPGVIIGFPVLDAAPYGLGLVTQPTVHTFSALEVSSPLLELERRNLYREARKLARLGPSDLSLDSAS